MNISIENSFIDVIRFKFEVYILNVIFLYNKIYVGKLKYISYIIFLEQDINDNT